MFFTMVILAVFLILHTHICSALILMPKGQPRRSNAFSSLQHPQVWLSLIAWILGTECWHITTHNTTTITGHLKPQKHVQTKPPLLIISALIMLSSHNMLVTSASATSGDVPANNGIFDSEDANAFIYKVIQDHYAIFSPPAPRPMHTNFPSKASAAASKTKLKANLKGEKEMKAKVAMEKKAATAAAKLAARTKRQEKLIAAAEIKAHKAMAKAKVLAKELKDAIAVKEQDSIHTKKKSKGAAGQLSATFLSTAAPLRSPQRKQGSPKKRVSQHSPHQGEKDRSTSNEDKSMGDNVSLTPHGNGQLVSAGEGHGVAALPRGGCCYGSPGHSQHGSSSSSEHSLSGSNS
jgi:hypothetical protein